MEAGSLSAACRVSTKLFRLVKLNWMLYARPFIGGPVMFEVKDEKVEEEGA